MRPKIRAIIRWVWLTAGLAFTAWMVIGFQASDVPADATRSDPRVAVTVSEGGMNFRVAANPRRTGLIFLPGGMVDPIAYAPLMKRIAGEGHPVHLVYLPWRCACTDSQVMDLFQRIQAIIAGEPGTAWILAGHSRGAMLAARFVHENASPSAGLILIATTHPRDFSLARASIPVVKVYGTRDGIASYSKMLPNRHLLPPDTRWIGIEGGNHVQFAHYRHQLGDSEASISRDHQQSAIEKAILESLAKTTFASKR